MAAPNDLLFEGDYNRSTFSGAPTIVALSGSTARSTQLAVGVYYLTADTDCFFLQGASAVTAATTSVPCFRGQVYGPLKITDNTNYGYFAGITTGGAGNLYLIPVQ